VSRQQGVSEAKLRALAEYETSPLFSDEERAVLRYVDAMTETPVDVPDEVFGVVRALYDDGQIVELTAAIAWENYRARFDHALGVEAEGFSARAYCPPSVV
jgi:alkylhydroperoxidase family enzyme